jgi:hypothetical protein
VTTKDEHLLQHSLIAVFTIALLAIFGMVLLLYETVDQPYAPPQPNAAGMATCAPDWTCFDRCAADYSGRQDISITQACTRQCCRS